MAAGPLVHVVQDGHAGTEIDAAGGEREPPSRTSTMWPVDMRPPLAIEWMSVSSRSIMRVFLGVSGEYERV